MASLLKTYTLVVFSFGSSMSHSYSTQRDKNLSKLTKLAVNTRRYDGRTPDSPATSVANQVITSLS